jgi:hypothetical protein
MTAFAPDMFGTIDTDQHGIIVLKAVQAAEYVPQIPSSPQAQTNPEGVALDLVGDLESLREQDVAEWVERNQGDGIQLLAAFADRGLQGEILGSSYRVLVSRSDSDVIRRAARTNYAEWLRANAPGARVDHLVGAADE